MDASNYAQNQAFKNSVPAATNHSNINKWIEDTSQVLHHKSFSAILYPFRAKLVELDALRLFPGRPIEDIEHLFLQLFRDDTKHAPLTESDFEWLKQILTHASKKYNHDSLRLAVESVAIDWEINMFIGDGQDEMIGMLLALSHMLTPFVNVKKNSEDENKQYFGLEEYWPKLRMALEYEPWTAEQLQAWKTWKSERWATCKGSPPYN